MPKDPVEYFMVVWTHSGRHLRVRQVFLLDCTRNSGKSLPAAVCHRYANRLTQNKTVTIDADVGTAMFNFNDMTPEAAARLESIPVGYTKLDRKTFLTARLLIMALLRKDNDDQQRFHTNFLQLLARVE